MGFAGAVMIAPISSICRTIAYHNQSPTRLSSSLWTRGAEALEPFVSNSRLIQQRPENAFRFLPFLKSTETRKFCHLPHVIVLVRLKVFARIHPVGIPTEEMEVREVVMWIALHPYAENLLMPDKSYFLSGFMFLGIIMDSLSWIPLVSIVFRLGASIW